MTATARLSIIAEAFQLGAVPGVRHHRPCMSPVDVEAEKSDVVLAGR
jgi:hypothetical protein